MRDAEPKDTWHVPLQSSLPIASISLLLVLPCIWQSHIESTDLASHIYNAWLSRLIATEHLPGLWLNHQVVNVVFDYLLMWSLSMLGPLAAERLCVFAAVLIFFWGAFTFISELSDRRPWFLLPCLAMLAYSRVFYLGFFNFYLSLGFSFFALALFWKTSRVKLILAAGAMLVACCCHPLPPAWAMATAVYVWSARRSSPKVQAALFSISLVALVAVALFQRLRFPVPGLLGFGARIRQLLSVVGWEQLIVFPRPFFPVSYRVVELGLVAIFCSLVIPRLLNESEFRVSIPVQLYALLSCAWLILPRTLHLPFLFPTSLGFISDRLSLVAAVLGCSLMGGAHVSKWLRASLMGLAALYFILLYQDQRRENEIELKASQLVSQLPPRQRVVAFLPYPGVVGQQDVNSIVDRACVGHCFSYGDYEPSTQQFRIRAAPDNAFVLWSHVDVNKLELGTYIVQCRDLPLYEIYRCGVRTTDLCIRPLVAGEINGKPSKAEPGRNK